MLPAILYHHGGGAQAASKLPPDLAVHSAYLIDMFQ